MFQYHASYNLKATFKIIACAARITVVYYKPEWNIDHDASHLVEYWTGGRESCKQQQEFLNDAALLI